MDMDQGTGMGLDMDTDMGTAAVLGTMGTASIRIHTGTPLFIPTGIFTARTICIPIARTMDLSIRGAAWAVITTTGVVL